MRHVRKQIVTDKTNRPVAVQISYENWFEVERRLGNPQEGGGDLRRFRGVLRLREDPLEFQRDIRGE